jgi:hypothetical protein
MLAGHAPYVSTPTNVPPITLLPANERRRAVRTVKLALAVGVEAFTAAGCEAARTATVFSSSGSDGETIHNILEVLASDAREISPTAFHNSVHGAPAGYWSIATGARAPSNSICCYDASFAAGLLEAAVWATAEDRNVALIAYDVSYPEPLYDLRRIDANFATALVFSPRPTDASLASLAVELQGRSGRAAGMNTEEFETLRQAAPAARCLPLLASLARGTADTLVLDYVSGLEIALEIKPIAGRANEAAGGGS